MLHTFSSLRPMLTLAPTRAHLNRAGSAKKGYSFENWFAESRLINSSDCNRLTTSTRLPSNEGETRNLFMDVQLPENYDRAELYFWNSGSKLETSITGFTIEAYNE